MPFDIARIRAQFPALQRDAVFLDNPGGTQVARLSLERTQSYLVDSNANHGGAFATSHASDALVDAARAACADFLNASRPEEIVFGANMTTLTFSISRAIGRLLAPGDTIVVTRLDHDANISPWLLLAEDHGCRVRWVDFHPEDCTLDLDDFRAALTEKPRLVAFGYASNAVGTINPAVELTRLAHAAGALVYIDAVQYAPHSPIDVQELGCDFLVCSAYKFFGPHVGVLYGKYELLEHLQAYKVRPAPKDPPGKFETGTGNFEGYAGVLGALEYLQWVGVEFGGAQRAQLAGRYAGRRLDFKAGMSAIHAQELDLSNAVADLLQELPGARVYGITDAARFDQRVPTFSFTLQGHSPREVAQHLGEAGIYVWDGNYYALAVTERLGLEASGGMVRVGPVHYNSVEEIHRLGEALARIAAG